jgi:hypothetical protein
VYLEFAYVASLLCMVHNLKFLVTLDNTSNFIRGTFSFYKILFFYIQRFFTIKKFFRIVLEMHFIII